jgi:hypothetical protein
VTKVVCASKNSVFSCLQFSHAPARQLCFPTIVSVSKTLWIIRNDLVYNLEAGARYSNSDVGSQGLSSWPTVAMPIIITSIYEISYDTENKAEIRVF